MRVWLREDIVIIVYTKDAARQLEQHTRELFAATIEEHDAHRCLWRASAGRLAV
jgi:hypothetical protein